MPFLFKLYSLCDIIKWYSEQIDIKVEEINGNRLYLLRSLPAFLNCPTAITKEVRLLEFPF